MTPQEKWKRLNNPTCLEDYGLFLSRNELMQFPEGRAYVEMIDGFRKEREERNRLMEILGKAASQTIDDCIKNAVFK